MTEDGPVALESDLPDAATRLAEDGWCVLPDVLSPEETSIARDRLWKAADAYRQMGGETHMPILDPNDSNVRIFYLLEIDQLFRDMIQHPLAIQMVRQVLGKHFLISNFTANIARPGSKSMALHSDQSLVVPEPWLAPWAVNIIWCLDDVYFENGATLFIPGSHKWTSKAEVPADANTRLRPFEAKAGSIVVMDGRMWHTSGANITRDQDRALMFGYYSAPFLRPQVNWNACLSPGVQATLSPQMREWLGLDIEANTGQAMDLRYLEDQFSAQVVPV